MGKRKVAIEYETVIRNGVYEPVRKGYPAESRQELSTDLIPIGFMDNKFVKAEISVHKGVIVPIAFGLAAIGLIFQIYQEIDKRKH